MDTAHSHSDIANPKNEGILYLPLVDLLWRSHYFFLLQTFFLKFYLLHIC